MTVGKKDAPTPETPRRNPDKEIKPGLWKLLAAAGGILVVVFLAMELVDDTYLHPIQSTGVTQQIHGAG